MLFLRKEAEHLAVDHVGDGLEVLRLVAELVPVGVDADAQGRLHRQRKEAHQEKILNLLIIKKADSVSQPFLII